MVLQDRGEPLARDLVAPSVLALEEQDSVLARLVVAAVTDEVKDVEVTVVQLAQERIEGCRLSPVDFDATLGAQRPQRRFEALALAFDVEPGQIDDVADHAKHAQRRADGERGLGPRNIQIADHGGPHRDRQEVRFVVEVLPRDVHELGHLGERQRHAQTPVLAPRIG